MTADPIIAALRLPVNARVDQRVPKKLLVENGAPTAADKRQINDGIEELLWLAALKPSTIGVPTYRDETREYLEIAVLSLTLRAGARSASRSSPTGMRLPTRFRMCSILSEAKLLSNATRLSPPTSYSFPSFTSATIFDRLGHRRKMWKPICCVLHWPARSVARRTS